MGRRLVLLLVVALLALPGGASAATRGEQRILLMLTTWGPEPYAPGVLRAELDEAGAYMRSVSFGKTWLVGDVTPRLARVPAAGADLGVRRPRRRPGCRGLRGARTAFSSRVGSRSGAC